MAQKTTDSAEIKQQLERIFKGLDEHGYLRTAEDYKIGLILESGAEIIAEFNEFSMDISNDALTFYYAISETSDIYNSLEIIRTEDYAEYYDHECLKNNQQPQKVRFSNAADLKAIADVLKDEDVIRHPGTTSWE